MYVVVNPFQYLHGRHLFARISCAPDVHIENQGQKFNGANGSKSEFGLFVLHRWRENEGV